MNPHIRPLLGFIAVISSATAEEVKRFEPTGSLPYLSVEESLKTFHLPEGYRLEPVLTEPVIAEPVAAAFDGRVLINETRFTTCRCSAHREDSYLS